MTTPRNRAIYFAKQAFALMQMRGLSAGLIRLDTEDGARWSFTHDESGFVVILKHAADHAHGGAVDAARTREANIARVKEEMRAARLAEAGLSAGGLAYAQECIAAGATTEDAIAAARTAEAREAAAKAEEPAPAAVRYIDATPTWAAILPALLAAVTDGTAEGQRIARAELIRMARAADSAVAAAKAAPVAWRTGSDVTLNAERADNWRAMGAKVYPLFQSAPN